MKWNFLSLIYATCPIKNYNGAILINNNVEEVKVTSLFYDPIAPMLDQIDPYFGGSTLNSLCVHYLITYLVRA